MAQQRILNLGCGTRTSESCVNLDWTLWARLASRPAAAKLVYPFLGSLRGNRLRSMTGTVIAHDLRKGIPFPDRSVDAVYLSHVVEHIDRDQAAGLLSECRRVLVQGGTIRIVVPDLARLIEDYQESYRLAVSGSITWQQHDKALEPILEQSVRRQSRAVVHTWPAIIQRAMTVAIGDARKRGETHQWMYDDVTLSHLLLSCDFVDTTVCDPYSSAIEGWKGINLDLENGSEYKPKSLYLEAQAPAGSMIPAKGR